MAVTKVGGSDHRGNNSRAQPSHGATDRVSRLIEVTTFSCGGDVAIGHDFAGLRAWGGGSAMSEPSGGFKVGAIVWALLIGAGIVFLAGSILLPSTKRARVDWDEVRRL